ncbi:hypothetical protein ACWGDX_13250 [Streptomyces sp. NPDC055025]
MSSARHFFPKGTLSSEALDADIKADVSTSRTAQRDLQEAGQHGLAADMGRKVDEHLDELNDAKTDSWKPRHSA